MKLRQYEVGKRFCDAVVEREGVVALHRVFGSPAALPTWAELEDPDRGWSASARSARGVAPHRGVALRAPPHEHTCVTIRARVYKQVFDGYLPRTNKLTSNKTPETRRGIHG